MFQTVAPRYDFITRAFSAGMDMRWKRDAVADANLPDGAVVLDLACGTGDFSRLVEGGVRDAKAVALDLTAPMLTRARQAGTRRVVCGDATNLPFADGSFDGVFVGYGLRNFPDLGRSLREISRVLKSGGVLVSHDFFLPEPTLWRIIYLAYLYVQGAFWGLVLHGQPRIYTYIPDSLRAFVSIRRLSAQLRAIGFRAVRERQLVAGGLGIHWAVKG